MANEDNLHPVRTEKEAREKGRQGGIKSGEARRRKRDMKAAIRLLMDMPATSPNTTSLMSELGLEKEDQTNLMAVVLAMYNEALHGSVSAAAFLRDTAGMNPSHKENLAMRKEEMKLRREEFDYRRQKEAGIEYEIEDLDEIEGIIYGDDNVCEATGKPEGSETTEDNTV
ncbi:MAG: hypothetical protein II897_03890 [Clostridia bacterium]|nr:hypothetical protein [Clostridia bacterium]